MALTKIPLICGSKSSNYISPRSQLKRKHSSPYSHNSFEKVQGLFRYHLENESLDSYSNDLNTNCNDLSAPSQPSSVSSPRCLQSCNTFHFSEKLQSVESRLELLDLCRHQSISHNFNDYLSHRSRGLFKNQFASVNHNYGTHKMIQNSLFQENVINLCNVNKIFCSKWLNNNSIVMGTKCNQLLLYDVKTKQIDDIPSLRGRLNEHPLCERCGIHALEINPSGTLMATGGQNSNEIGIYRLPTLDPVCTAENAHCDSVFDLCWLDDEFFVSASRDKSLAIWRIDEDCISTHESQFHGFVQPLAVKMCCAADKVRALLFNPHRMEIVALSLNAKIHVWHAAHFKQVLSQKLELVNENVCMAKTDNCSMYAIGSKCHVTLLDPRTLQSLSKIDSRKSSPNIRSLSFRGSLLTIGTGTGDILFYDVKAARFMEKNHGSPELNCSKCKISSENSNVAGSAGVNLSDSAIYTHCYDWSGTRLFAAGGPLSAATQGCYASLWC